MKLKVIEIKIPVWFKTIIATFVGGLLGAVLDAIAKVVAGSDGAFDLQSIWKAVGGGAVVFVLGYLKESPWRETVSVSSKPTPEAPTEAPKTRPMDLLQIEKAAVSLGQDLRAAAGQVEHALTVERIITMRFHNMTGTIRLAGGELQLSDVSGQLDVTVKAIE